MRRKRKQLHWLHDSYTLGDVEEAVLIESKRLLSFSRRHRRNLIGFYGTAVRRYDESGKFEITVAPQWGQGSPESEESICDKVRSRFKENGWV